jgi:hypothetical protein
MNFKPIYGYDTSISNYNQYSFVEPQTPYTILNLDFTANRLNNQLFEEFTSNGSTTIDDGVATLSITSSIYAYNTLRCKKVIKYRGKTTLFKSAVKFDSNAVANSLQMVGLGTSSNDIYLGMSGTDFVARVSNSGSHQIVVLTITANPSGAETISVTLNSVLFTGSVTASGSLSFSAHLVEEMNAWTGWSFQHVGSTIIFMGGSVGARTGTYSISSTGTLTGTFSTENVGTSLSTSTTTLANFNGDPVMKRRFNPFVWNSLMISYNDDVSNINFYALNEITGIYQLLHTQRYNNTNLTSFSQADFFAQRLVASVGSTTALSMQVSSISVNAVSDGFQLYIPKYSVTTTETIAANVEEVILTLQHRLVLNDIPCINEIYLDTFSISCDGTKSVLIKVIRNPTTIGASTSTNFDNFVYVNDTYSQCVYDTTSTTYTGGVVVYSFYVDKVSTTIINLFEKGIVIGRSESVIFTATSTGNSDLACSLTLIEDI